MFQVKTAPHKAMASQVLRNVIPFGPISGTDRSNASKALRGFHGPCAMKPLAGRIMNHWRECRDPSEPVPSVVSLAAQVLREDA